MAIPLIVDTNFNRIANFLMAVIPRSKPSQEKFQQAKVISHRGKHDNQTVFENTFAAFDPFLTTDIWGIELDIRWTKDFQPIVFHDADARRLYADETIVAECTLVEFQQRFPNVPSLKQVVERYGKKLHLMIELKLEQYRDTQLQMQALQQALTSLSPIRDYHLISLFPQQMFPPLHFFPSECLLPISIFNNKQLCELSLQNDYGGLLGQYVFMRDNEINQQLRYNKHVGVGFVDSKNSLWRELNRGVEWLFSNKAEMIQKYINENKS